MVLNYLLFESSHYTGKRKYRIVLKPTTKHVPNPVSRVGTAIQRGPDPSQSIQRNNNKKGRKGKDISTCEGTISLTKRRKGYKEEE